MLKYLSIASIIAVGLLGGHASAQSQGAVVAKVNGKSITETDMRLAESDLAPVLKNLAPDLHRRVVADFLIENQLLADAAKAAKQDASSDFEARLQYATRKILRDQYFQARVASTVTESEARKLFNEQIKALRPEEEVRARHILVESEGAANDLRARIVQGADFATVARESSKDPGTVATGGDLGYFMKGQMDEAFEAAVFPLGKDVLSPPFQTPFGWHIVLVEDRRIKSLPTFEQLKPVIMDRLVLVKTREVITELRSHASVDIVDPALKIAAAAPPSSVAPPASVLPEPPPAALPRSKVAAPPKAAAKRPPAQDTDWQTKALRN